MYSLREVQTALCAAVVSGYTQTVPHLILDDGIPVEERLDIYRNNNRTRTLTALESTYPVVARLAGADWFRQTSAQYQQASPSRSGNLQYVGENFPDFLRRYLAHTAYEYFADVASLEWEYQVVLTAAERPCLDLALLREVSPAERYRIVFVPRPAMRLVESRYPLFSIWQANQPSRMDGDFNIDLGQGSSHVLLIRRPDHVEVREISRGTFQLLRQFQMGIALEPAASAVANNVPEFVLESSLKEALSLETIASIAL